MSLIVFTIAVIMGLMLAEWQVSLRHDARLDALGATAPPEPQYPLMAVAYPAAFLAMGGEAVLRGNGPGWLFPSGVLLFLGAKALKYWAIASLGERWTFRVRIVQGQPLVASGPYQYVRHPNYIAVAGELAATAMMMSAVVTGPLMTAFFCVLMWRRVAFEERALAGQ
jgi:methyltransferase